MSNSVSPIPDGYPAVIPYLIVRNGKKALEYYQNTFGAVEKERLEMPDGTIGHAEILIGESMIVLADESPACGAVSPDSVGGTPVTIALYIEDVDTVIQRALDGGAILEQPIKNQFYGDRSGSIKDPFGHKWTIMTHIEDVSPEEISRRAAELFGTK